MDGTIIMVAKLKGGAGATTTCRELAAAALADGLDVALIDLDGQGTLTKWWNRRTKDAALGVRQPELLQVAAEQIPATTKALRARYDLIVIDSPPSVADTIRAVAAVTDLVLVPARPTTDDLDAVGPIVRLLHDVADIAFIQTQVPNVRSRDGADAHVLLAQRAPVVGRTTFRAEYSRPPSVGSTGFEMGKVAAQEVGALWACVRERLAIPVSRDTGKAVSGDDVTMGLEG